MQSHPLQMLQSIPVLATVLPQTCPDSLPGQVSKWLWCLTTRWSTRAENGKKKLRILPTHLQYRVRLWPGWGSLQTSQNIKCISRNILVIHIFTASKDTERTDGDLRHEKRWLPGLKALLTLGPICDWMGRFWEQPGWQACSSLLAPLFACPINNCPSSNPFHGLQSLTRKQHNYILSHRS